MSNITITVVVATNPIFKFRESFTRPPIFLLQIIISRNTAVHCFAKRLQFNFIQFNFNLVFKFAIQFSDMFEIFWSCQTLKQEKVRHVVYQYTSNLIKKYVASLSWLERQAGEQTIASADLIPHLTLRSCFVEKDT